MKNDLYRYVEEHREEIIELGDRLFMNPELGFREFRTREILFEYLNRHGFTIDREYAYTGFSVTIGKGRPHIGVIAEMDAIPTQGHPCADKETTAAHACGHSTQMAITLGVLSALKEQIGELEGTVTLFFTPAEEFTDMDYRHQLQKEGKIRYASGKQEMLANHIFDDVDCLIHMHAMGSDRYHFSIGSTLAGFIYKQITFIGRASHAAVLPHLGINALNECSLFLNAVNALRETFREEDYVRVHGRIKEGGNTVNSIPDRVIYEAYVRSANPDFLLKLNEQVNKAARHCAMALGGSAEIEDTPGYLPLIQDRELNEVVHDNVIQFTTEDLIHYNEVSIAAGDVGDISVFKPIIQYGYNGFSGRIHGADMRIADKEEVYIIQAKITAGIVYDLLNNKEKVRHIVENYRPKMTYEEYMNYLNQK